MSRRRSGVLVALAGAGTALVLLLGAIGAHVLADRGAAGVTAATEPQDAVRAAESRLLSPGTPLGNGFRVAAGSRLVGGVFPIVNRPYAADGVRHVPSGWAAQLLVDGAPLEVFNAYVEQAKAAGYPVWGGCAAATGERWSSVAAASGTADVVRCDAEYYRVAAGRSSMLRVAIQLLVGDYLGTPASHIGIRFYVEGDGTGSDTRFRNGPPLPPIRSALPRLRAVAARGLPGPGQPLAPGLSARTALRVPPSGQVIATPSYGVGCTSGYDAVLASDDVNAAMTGLRAQLGAVSDAPLKQNGRSVAGQWVTVAETDATGDTRAVVTAMSRGKRGLILVSSC